MTENRDQVIVGFRTHYWDEVTTILIKKLEESISEASNFKVVILADETNGELNVPVDVNVEKVSHNNDFSSFGLTNVPTNRTLWWNGEYPLYVLQRKYPNAKFYVMVENDVLITANFAKLIKNAIKQGVDWFAEGIEKFPGYEGIQKRSTSNWKVPKYRSYMQILGVSNEALSELLETRLERMKFFDGTDNTWAYVEIFIATALINSDKNFRYLDLYDTNLNRANFTPNTAISVRDSRIWLPNQISHPVLSTMNAVNKLIKSNPRKLITVFDENSIFSAVLHQAADEGNGFEAVSAFAEAVQKASLSPFMAEKLFEVAASRNWVKGDASYKFNFALNRPTTQSSTRENGDSKRAVDGNIKQGMSHTLKEEKPWWQVDFETVRTPKKIVITYRSDGFLERLTKIRIFTSLNGRDYVKVLSDDNVTFTESENGTFQRIYILKETHARFLKIVADGETYLHLKQVEVY